MYEGSSLLASKPTACFQKSLQPLATLFMIGGLCYVLSTPYLWSDADKPGHNYAIFFGLFSTAVFVAMMAAYFSPHNEGWTWREETQTKSTLHGVFDVSDFSLNEDVKMDFEDFYSSDRD